MNKKTILITTSIICSLLFLTALMGSAVYFFELNPTTKTQRISAEDAAKSSAQQTIKMMGHWKGEDLREDFVLETMQEFETRNPDVKIDLTWNVDFPGGREDAISEIVKQIKSGTTTWDIIWLEPFYYQEIADALGDQNWAKNYLVDFETVPGFTESQKNFIISDPQFRNHMNGVLTGPYIEGFYQPFFYNKILADQIGLDIKETGMTADDLIGYVKTITDYNQKNGTSIAAFYEATDQEGGLGYGPTTWNIFQSLFRSEFPELEDVKITAMTPQKDAALKKTLGTLEQIGAYKPFIKGFEDIKWFETRNYVLEDKAVFTTAGASWMYSHWRGLDKQKTMNMVPVEMPVYQKVDHYIGGYNPMFAVMKNSPVRDEAVEFLMEFSKPNTAEKWVRYAKGPSGIKGNLSDSGDDRETADQYDKFISYITEQYGGNVYDTKTVDYILGRAYKDLSPKFYRHLVAVMAGEITASEAYGRIMADVAAVDN
jgi:hypothetical protein